MTDQSHFASAAALGAGADVAELDAGICQQPAVQPFELANGLLVVLPTGVTGLQSLKHGDLLILQE